MRISKLQICLPMTKSGKSTFEKLSLSSIFSRINNTGEVHIFACKWTYLILSLERKWRIKELFQKWAYLILSLEGRNDAWRKSAMTYKAKQNWLMMPDTKPITTTPVICKLILFDVVRITVGPNGLCADFSGCWIRLMKGNGAHICEADTSCVAPLPLPGLKQPFFTIFGGP